jgi:hypothetical protein
MFFVVILYVLVGPTTAATNAGWNRRASFCVARSTVLKAGPFLNSSSQLSNTHGHNDEMCLIPFSQARWANVAIVIMVLTKVVNICDKNKRRRRRRREIPCSNPFS